MTPTVAIVGGGASGALLAAQLLRRLHPAGLRVVVVERRESLGRGLAYSTPYDFHTLNVPAGRMGALPRDGGHFLRWARRTAPQTAPGDFLPRSRYGDYLAWLLDEAVARARPGVELVRVRDSAVGAEIEDDGVTLRLRDGETVRADRLVLAIGNLPPGPPPGANADLLGSDRYHGDPWDPRLPAVAEHDRSVLLIGTGLTMVDIALTLGDAFPDVRMRALSRNGLLPRVHADDPTVDITPFTLPHGDLDLDTLVADVDRRMAEAETAGGDWRHVIDSLRPVTNRIWGRLPAEQRERFVHDVSRHWEIRRHRMAPSVAERLDALRSSGRLSIEAAAITALRASADHVEVQAGGRGVPEAASPGAPTGVVKAAVGGAPIHFAVDRVVNCTGPSLAMGIAGEPLLAGLLQAGHVRPGPLGLGLDHDSRGHLVSAAGEPSRLVYGIGPVRKGHLWETTAIPEIRAQSLELADLLTAQLASRRASAA